MKSDTMQKLLKKESKYMQQLEEIVQQTIKEEELIMNNLLHPIQEKRGIGQVIADAITEFSGSMLFLFINAWFFAVWIGLNILPLGLKPFDPYPFGFLTMVVSLEAIFLSCFVLISQNREAQKDRSRNENDYLINAKAELEIRSLHQKLDLLVEEQIKTLYETQEAQYHILTQIEKKLDNSQHI
jgi:uncharacterized membrane protein